nr:hypothetical protein [Tanacetum cinerariifolium]
VTKAEGNDGVAVSCVGWILWKYYFPMSFGAGVTDWYQSLGYRELVPIVEPNQRDDVLVVPEPVLVDEDKDPKEDKFKEEEDPQEEEDDMEIEIEEDENEPEDLACLRDLVLFKETLHVNFLENKPNLVGSGPTWLFDIDSLTRTMNYQPVNAGNQTNPSVGFQYKFDAKKAREENDQQYVLFPVWSSGSTNPQNYDGDDAFDEKEHDFDAKKLEFEVNVSPSSSAQSGKQDDKTKKKAKGKSHVESSTGYRHLSAEFEDCSENSSNEVNVTGSIVPTVGQNSFNNTNPFSAAGPSNTTTIPIREKSLFKDAFQLLDDPDMSEFEDITYSDDENVGAEADFNNLETSITVSPIPTTKIHKDHPVSQIIGDMSSTTQTRSMTRVLKDQGGLSQMFNDDFHTCMFACFLLQEEPKRVHQALKDPSWIEAMQEELLQFKMQKEEGIDYEEVFAPVARIEAIRLFLAYASFMGFMVYQMDDKSAFLYETVKEEVYVCQPLRFEDPVHLDNVYKEVKELYGLHQAPRACYETLANYLLENSFQKGKIDQTPFIKKQKGDILLVQIYVDDIIFGATNKDLCKSFEKLMKDKFQMSSMGELTFFLGLQKIYNWRMSIPRMQIDLLAV